MVVELADVLCSFCSLDLVESAFLLEEGELEVKSEGISEVSSQFERLSAAAVSLFSPFAYPTMRIALTEEHDCTSC
ncbi:MAG: hypothetical protein AB2602_12460 [Candidatus Thiodiazotropha sp.]